ncbi:MAG: ABC-2 family transporter protein [Deltaproteobacteria bacterium]|nr:ABC-2 family transporter protein [Deltaproteobacteria bacterium]
MKKYWRIYKVSWQRHLAYRFNFVLGRIRNVIVLLLLYFVWLNLTKASGRFAAWSGPELFTYVFGVTLLRSVIFGAQSREAAQEINDGTFSTYLLKPASHFWLVFFRELAERTLNLIAAVGEVLLLAFVLDVSFVPPPGGTRLLLFVVSCVLALFLYFVMSYTVSLFAFWSREAMGPRFLYEWILEFASGAYFPLDILSRPFRMALQALPFSGLIYLPVTIYLGRHSASEAGAMILFQMVWLAVLSASARLVWRRGLKRFTGEGI